MPATGLIANVYRSGGALTAAFSPRAGQTVSLNLTQRPDGGWSGDLSQGGERRAVRLVRDEPMLDVAPMFGVAGVVSPYRTSQSRAAPARQAAPSQARRGKAVKGKAAKGKASKATAKRKPAVRKKR